MELNTTELILWNEFKELLFKHIELEFASMNTDTYPELFLKQIESSIDLFTELHCLLPHSGINFERGEEIIRGVAFLTKKKLFNDYQ